MEELAELQRELFTARNAVNQTGVNLNQAVAALNATGQPPVWLEHAVSRVVKRRGGGGHRGCADSPALVVIPAVHPRGANVGGLLRYLFGPGKREEHERPRVVAAWDGAGPFDALQSAAACRRRARRARVDGAVGTAGAGRFPATCPAGRAHLDDHIHLVAMLIRQDRARCGRVRTNATAQAACRDIEDRYRLHQVAPPRQGVAPTVEPGRVNKATRPARRCHGRRAAGPGGADGPRRGAA